MRRRELRGCTVLMLREAIQSLTSIEALAPSADNTVVVTLDHAVIQQLAGAQQTERIFDFVYLVCGIEPPVSNIGYHERGSDPVDEPPGLRRPRAIFRGLRRPMIESGADGQVYIYVVDAFYRYRYVPSMVCCARRVRIAADLVFVTYVRFDSADWDNGLIVGWDWVIADPTRAGFPKGAGERYEEEVFVSG